MKYMGKFSRRFKYADDAFATINGGVRRQGGNMTRLQRVPAGRKGIEFRHAGNSSLENSPLIKTPDWKPKTPEGTTRIKGSAADDSTTNVKIEPSQKKIDMGKPGDQAVVTFDREDQENNTRETVIMAEVAPMAECIFCSSHKDPSGNAGIQENDTSRPASWEQDPNGNGIIITMQEATPSSLTFIDPVSGATATVNIDIIPPHDHRDMTRGGPAVAVYDTFGV